MQTRGGLKTVNSRFRCLEINEDLQRVYAGGYDSMIYIFSTKSSTPLLLKTFVFGDQYGYISWIERIQSPTIEGGMLMCRTKCNSIISINLEEKPLA
jgi:hypothetical protein